MLTVKRFSASWCSPCRQLAPIIESVSKDFPDVNFVTIDVDENKLQAQAYGIRSVPTIVFERDGEEISRFSGVRPAATLTQLISEAK